MQIRVFTNHPLGRKALAQQHIYNLTQLIMKIKQNLLALLLGCAAPLVRACSGRKCLQWQMRRQSCGCCAGGGTELSLAPARRCCSNLTNMAKTQTKQAMHKATWT